jgi:hypothetical protein
MHARGLWDPPVDRPRLADGNRKSRARSHKTRKRESSGAIAVSKILRKREMGCSRFPRKSSIERPSRVPRALSEAHRTSGCDSLRDRLHVRRGRHRRRRASNHGGKARRSAAMPERTNSGLRGLPRIKTSVAQGSEHVPLLNAEHREKKSGGLSKYVVPAIGGTCGLIPLRLSARRAPLSTSRASSEI